MLLKVLQHLFGGLVDRLRVYHGYPRRRRMHPTDEMMARITAERLVRHLEQSGFVLMKCPPAPAHSAP